MNAAIVGLGYVGLPLAREAVRAGLDIVGFDVNEKIVDGLNSAKSHVDDISSDDLAEMLASGFRATAEPAAISQAEIVVVCVPTPLDESGGPDLKYVISSMETIAANLRPGATVVLESTTYPGTTEEIVKPLFEKRGLEIDQDFYLAFSPERIDPGNKTFGAKNTPKVVGGLTQMSSDRAKQFYSAFIDEVVVVAGAKEAELAKLIENTYRHVNIALVNEMAKFCHELDINFWDAIRAAATKPFGFQPFYPGPGVGGHCIPIDPNYLSHSVRSKLGYPFRFVELAQEVNNSMPRYVVLRVQELLNENRIALNGASVLLLGVTYKADIADQRESPATPLAKQLQEAGAIVTYHDPFIEEWRQVDPPLARVDNLLAAVAQADLVILVQAHSDYNYPEIAKRASRILDTRNAFDDSGNVEKL
ncbi:nucleotide sugar dehydrogenase [Dietzia maris]|uniref:nucleotide sugar dehydrogenase n=1 Tax=Dietzia maris TaxID=37915 RepID=UPI0034506C35